MVGLEYGFEFFSKHSIINIKTNDEGNIISFITLLDGTLPNQYYKFEYSGNRLIKCIIEDSLCCNFHTTNVYEYSYVSLSQSTKQGMKIKHGNEIYDVNYIGFKVFKIYNNENKYYYQYSKSDDLIKKYDDNHSKMNTYKFEINDHHFHCDWKLGIIYDVKFDDDYRQSEFKMNRIMVKYAYKNDNIAYANGCYKYEYNVNDILYKVLYENKSVNLVNEKLQYINRHYSE
jgi:hypothetical protein